MSFHAFCCDRVLLIIGGVVIFAVTLLVIFIVIVVGAIVGVVAFAVGVICMLVVTCVIFAAQQPRRDGEFANVKASATRIFARCAQRIKHLRQVLHRRSAHRFESRAYVTHSKSIATFRVLH